MKYQEGIFQINGVTYRNLVTYIDIDSGEILYKTHARDKNKYIIQKTTKNGTTGSNAFKTIHLTRECKKQPQRTLFENLSR